MLHKKKNFLEAWWKMFTEMGDLLFYGFWNCFFAWLSFYMALFTPVASNGYEEKAHRMIKKKRSLFHRYSAVYQTHSGATPVFQIGNASGFFFFL